MPLTLPASQKPTTPNPLTAGNYDLQTNTSYKSPVPDFSGHGLDLSGNAVIGTIPPTAPVAKPSPVVSSQPAVNQANKAKTVVANPPTPPAYDTTTGLLTSYGKSQGLPEVNAPKVPTLTTQAQSPNTPTTPVSTPGNPTPEDSIIHEGQSQFYNNITGESEWLDSSKLQNGQPPSGYSTQNPKTRTDIVGTADAGAGDSVVIKQFSDGTYGRFNTSTGDYTPATSGDFAAAQRVGTANTALDNLQKGILSPAQQTQLDSLKSQFQALIDQQTVDNANATGGQTVAQNMYGLGNTTIGHGAITQTINDGAKAIADLQAKEQSAISSMMTAFESDDMNLLKSSYDQYHDAQTGIQKNIDSLQASIQAQQDSADLKNLNNNIAMDKKYPDAGILPGDTQSEMVSKRNESTIYKNEQLKNGALTQSALNKAASTALTLTDDEISTMAIQAAQDPTLLSKFGYGSSPNKEAILAKMADNIADGTTPGLASTKIDLNFAKNPATQNTLKYLGSLTGIGGNPGNLDELVRLSNTIDRTSFPPVNSAQFSALLNTGDPSIAAYGATLTEVSDQIAKILQGGGTGSGTSDAKLAQANAILAKNFTKDQIVGVANELKTLLENRKSALIGNNPFLQEYSTHPTTTSLANGGSSTPSDNDPLGLGL